MAAVKKAVKVFPFGDETLKLLKVLDPKARTQFPTSSGKFFSFFFHDHFYSCQFFIISKLNNPEEALMTKQLTRHHIDCFAVVTLAKQFPNVVDGTQINDLRKEYATYSSLPIEDTITDMPVDKFWSWVGKQKTPGTALPYFPLLAEFCQALCVLPHGNADCERVFSMVRHIKTEFRNQLGNETEQALLAVHRNALQNQGQCCYEVKVPKELLKEAKSATMRALAEYKKSNEKD